MYVLATYITLSERVFRSFHRCMVMGIASETTDKIENARQFKTKREAESYRKANGLRRYKLEKANA